MRLDYLNNKKNGGGLLGYTFADDRNGIGPDINGDPNKGANRTALSLGLSYAFNLETTIKAEYRSTAPTCRCSSTSRAAATARATTSSAPPVVVAF